MLFNKKILKIGPFEIKFESNFNTLSQHIAYNAF